VSLQIGASSWRGECGGRCQFWGGAARRIGKDEETAGPDWLRPWTAGAPSGPAVFFF